MPNVVLSEEKNAQLRDLMISAQQQLMNIGKIIPENKEVMDRFPHANPIGYHSEIDMEFGERLKRCDNINRLKNPLVQIEYRHLKDRIQKHPVYQEMRERMEMLSQKLKVVDRALRLCKDEELKLALEEKKEELKNDPIVKDYNMVVNTLEAYSGVRLYQRRLGDNDDKKRERFEMTRFCYENFGINIGSDLGYSPFGKTGRVSTPKALEVEFDNLHDIMQARKAVSDENLGKSWEEVQAQEVDGNNMDENELVVRSYMGASCERLLDSVLPEVEDRADYILIDGVSVREKMRQEANIENPTAEEIRTYSSLYVAAALRNGNYVEAFTKDYIAHEDIQINYTPVPIVAKGKDSYILKDKGKDQLEDLTIGFFDRILAKLGFSHYKEKVEKSEARLEAIRQSRERFREAHVPANDTERDQLLKTTGVLKDAPTKKEMENKKQSFNILAKYKNNFLAFRESNLDYAVNQQLLDEQFFPKNKGDVINQATGIVVESNREKLRLFAIVKMLEKNIPLEEVLDPMKHVALREEIGDEVREELTNCDAKTFFQKHVDVMDVIAEKLEAYAKEKGITYSNPATVLGKAAPLLELAVGAGNVPDIFMKSIYKDQIVAALGEDEVKRVEKKTEGLIINGMTIDFRTKAVKMYEDLANGVPISGDAFQKAIYAEVVLGIFQKLEKETGNVYDRPITLEEVKQLQEMVTAHPKVDRFFRETSQDKLFDLMVKGKLLKELKVDFEIFPTEMTTEKAMSSQALGVSIDEGEVTPSKYFPTVDGKTDFYELEPLEKDDLEL